MIEPLSGSPFGVPVPNCSAGSLPDLQASAANQAAAFMSSIPVGNHEFSGGGGDSHYTSHPLATQRHSVQLPVQFGQKFGGGAHAGTIAGYATAYGGAPQMVFYSFLFLLCQLPITVFIKISMHAFDK